MKPAFWASRRSWILVEREGFKERKEDEEATMERAGRTRSGKSQ